MGSKIPVTGVYIDPETGKEVTTHSMIKTMRRCPKQFQYKYIERLKPKVLGRPLRYGTWMHELLEVNARGENWRNQQKRNVAKFKKYFDEEQDMLGDLPNETARAMKAYLWHYTNDDWEVQDVEFMLETNWPDGSIYRAKLDLLIENEFGLWVVDHKNLRSFPDISFRILDAQSALYIWAAIKNGIPVQGHIWNYLKSKPPGIPKLLKDGTRLSKRKIDTDYVTLLTTIKQHGLDPKDYLPWLRQLRAQQYQHGMPQASPFFQRVILEKQRDMVRQVALEGYMTHKAIHSYPWHKPDQVERSPDRSCSFMCSYVDLCSAELFGGNGDQIRRTQFTQGDPLDYYYDRQDKGKTDGQSQKRLLSNCCRKSDQAC